MKKLDALYFSIVYPGVGQFFQRRWTAGIFFGGVSTALLIHFGFVFWRILRAYYSFAIDFDSPIPPHPSWGILMLDFALLTGVYVLNILDVWRITRRQKAVPPPVPPPV